MSQRSWWSCAFPFPISHLETMLSPPAHFEAETKIQRNRQDSRVRWSICPRILAKMGMRKDRTKSGSPLVLQAAREQSRKSQKLVPSHHSRHHLCPICCSTVLTSQSPPLNRAQRLECVGRGAWRGNLTPPPSCPQITCDHVHLLPWLYLYFELFSQSFPFFRLFLILFQW